MKRFYIFTIFIAFILGCNDEERNSDLSELGRSTIDNLDDGILDGNLYKTTTLTQGSYVLRDMFIVKEGTTLTIPKGTQIKASTEGIFPIIIVEQGAFIHIKGTAENPVLFTSLSKEEGSSGGLMICGNAPIQREIESESKTTIGGFKYGGTIENDSSGSISYLVIEYPGDEINKKSITSGLLLYGVGSGTKINNISIKKFKYDAIQIYGGNVNLHNIYIKSKSYFTTKGCAINWREGWNGTVKNAFLELGFNKYALSGNGVYSSPKFINLTSGKKKIIFNNNSGAIFNNLHMIGGNINIEEGNSLDHILVNGAVADITKVYTGVAVDISTWDWKDVEYK